MRWAIITGASSGIGSEFARHLASEKKFRLLLIARRRERLENLARELKNTWGAEAEIFALDLTQADATDKIAAYIKTSNASVAWLVNNAGFGYSGAFDGQGEKNISEMMTLNMTNLTLLTRKILPFMGTFVEGKDPEPSYILNVASSVGFTPMANFAVYAATKAYVLSLSSALHEELKSKKILVSALCPGPVKTEFFDVARSEAKEQGSYSPPEWLTEDPAKTAWIGLGGTEDGKGIITSGFAAASLRALSTVLPTSLLAKMGKAR